MRVNLQALVFMALLANSVLGSACAEAETWSEFYKPSSPKQSTARVTDAHCLAAILDAQDRFGIPDNLLLSIGIQEAGRQIDDGITVWPWSVNAEGKGIFFRSSDQAIEWVRTQLRQGVRSIDVGCMQINLLWHPDAFRSLEEAFDPMANAAYAARFLTELKRSEGSWWEAAGSYHSKTAELRNRYLTSLRRNQAVAAAHYERLVRLAKTAGTSMGSLARAASLLPRPPVLWGADAEKTNRFSIYSRKPLTPVLPVFEEVF